MKRKRAIIDSQNNEEDAVERLIYNGVPGSISKPNLNTSHLQSIDEDGEFVISSQGETSMEISNCSQDINNQNPNVSLGNYLPSGLLDSSTSMNNVNAVINNSTINSSVVTDTADVTLTNESLNDSILTDVGNTTAVLSYNTRASSSSSSVVRDSCSINSNNDAPLTRTALKKRKVIQAEERKQQQLKQKEALNISFSSPLKVRSRAQQLTDSASKALVQMKNSPVALK
jgi:hypothetical protein